MTLPADVDPLSLAMEAVENAAYLVLEAETRHQQVTRLFAVIEIARWAAGSTRPDLEVGFDAARTVESVTVQTGMREGFEAAESRGA